MPAVPSTSAPGYDPNATAAVPAMAEINLRPADLRPAKISRGGGSADPDPEDVPFDVWAASAVDWAAGTFTAVIHRKKPLTFIINGRQHLTGGRLGEIHECPTEALIATLYGGGEGHCEILGPGNNGQPKFFGQRSWRLAEDPKPTNSRGMDVNEARGNGMSDNVVTRVIDVMARRAEKAEERAEATRGDVGVVPEHLLSLAQTAGAATARVEAVQASTEARFTRERLEALERENAALREKATNGHGGIGEVLSGVKDLLGTVRPSEQPRYSDGRDSDYYGTVIRDMRDRHDREIENLRKLHEERINALRDDNRRALDQLREDHRLSLERERDLAKSRQDDNESRHRAELDRVRESERYANAQAIGAKDARIETLQHEMDRIRDDGRKDREREQEEKREWKDRALRAEASLSDLQRQVTKLEVELAHAPKEARGLAGQVKEIASARKALQDLLGIDEDKGDHEVSSTAGSIFSGIKDLLDHPVADAVVKRVADKVTGQAEIDRKKEEKLAALNVLREKQRGLMNLKGLELQNKRLELARSLGLQPPGVANQGAPATSVAATAAPAASAPARSPYWDAGDPPMPDSPTKRVISDALAGFKTLLLSAEEYVVTGQPASAFVDEMAKQMPLTAVRDMLLAQFPTHTVFLQEMADEGADRAFPPLYHPAGRRWLKDVWETIQKRVGAPGIDAINRARGAANDEDDAADENGEEEEN